MTPLMHAVKDNRTPILDRLIDLGSDVGARNNVSNTAVYYFNIYTVFANIKFNYMFYHEYKKYD